MALRKIVVQGEECLTKVCRPVTEFNPRLHQLLDDMTETLEDANPHSYEDAVGRMKGYMFSRAEWLDENIQSLYQYCHRSKNAAQWVQ